MTETKQIIVDIPQILRALAQPVHDKYRAEVIVNCFVRTGDNRTIWTVQIESSVGRGETFNLALAQAASPFEKKRRAVELRQQAANLIFEAKSLEDDDCPF